MMNNVSKGSLKTAQEYFKSLDLFGKSVTFKVNNKEKFTSVLGALLSILVIAVTLTYG